MTHRIQLMKIMKSFTEQYAYKVMNTKKVNFTAITSALKFYLVLAFIKTMHLKLYSTVRIIIKI